MNFHVTKRPAVFAAISISSSKKKKKASLPKATAFAVANLAARFADSKVRGSFAAANSYFVAGKLPLILAETKVKGSKCMFAFEIAILDFWKRAPMINVYSRSKSLQL